MITGEINFAGEAVVRLEVGNESGGREVLEAEVDTGFTGYDRCSGGLRSSGGLAWSPASGAVSYHRELAAIEYVSATR